jgi:two-component system LytT family response regulator
LQSRPADDANRHIIGLLETIVSPRRHMKRLAVRSAGKTVFVDVDDIDWIDAAENYVQLHCGKTVHLLHVPMNTLERSLSPETFLRIHRSTIVNVGRIKDLQPGVHGEYVITLRSGVQLQSGRTYQEKLRALTANPFGRRGIFRLFPPPVRQLVPAVRQKCLLHRQGEVESVR